MKRPIVLSLSVLVLLPVLAGAADVSDRTMTSVVFIANYDNDDNFLGWGSGFFVDEGIVVTNKHVIEGGDWYRVYATSAAYEVDLDCRKNITKSDVKINLDDDVAYMRVFLPCEHGASLFADDPIEGDPAWILGYPYRGSTAASMTLLTTSGSVTGKSDLGWMTTDAPLDLGNSGGPVVNDSGVIGVAVAKSISESGEHTGYFIQSSVILNGLLYANDSRFGYTPQSSSSRSSSRSSSSVSSTSVASSSSRSSSRSSSSRSSSRSSVRSFPDVYPSLPGYEAILALRVRGVIGGYPDGTFRPDAGINRAEFVKLLVAGFRSETLRDETDCFSDVGDEWFAQYVCAAKRLGWIGGYPDGTFRPAQPVNRAEGMKIVVEAFGGGTSRNEDAPSDVRVGTWFYPYVADGVEIGIVSSAELFHPERDLTREHAAMWIYGAEGK